MINLAIVGATGLVGKEFIKLIEERKFPYNKLFLFASSKNKGKRIKVNNKFHIVKEFKEELFHNIDIAFFSAGKSIDKKLVPLAKKHGTICIDNSSAFRMHNNIPLIVPEINFNTIKKSKIIANPNCSTIQLVLVLDILKRFKIKRVNITTFQAVSGAGKDLLETYKNQSKEKKGPLNIPIYNNVLQSIGKKDKYGFCEEENKLINETRKILNNYSLQINATTLRVPVSHVHVESVEVEFSKNIDMKNIKSLLKKYPERIKLMEEIINMNIKNSNFVYITRLRKDKFKDNTIHFLVSADNLRIGAALNGIKIAEKLIQ